MKENRALSGGLCALGCEVLYGLSYLFTKRTADAASALALLGWRFIVALAVMSLCVALGLVKIRLRGRRLWPLLRVALFCPCLYFIGETVGIRETTVTESGVFLACVPALSLLASAVILKKKPTRRQVVGISITFLGVMTTVIAVGISSSLSPMGYAALMLAVAAYALYSVFVDLASDYTGAEITYAMLLSGAAFYGLLALGEAAAHGTLTALLTLPVKNGAFRTAVLYQGVGVFPIQCGDCENRREQNVVVHRRIDHRFDFGRGAGAGRAAAYRADRRRGGDRGGRIHGEPSVENIKAKKIPCPAERVPTERGIFDVLWGIS